MKKEEIGLEFINFHEKSVPYKFLKWNEMWSSQGVFCKVEHLTEISNNEMIFSACVKIDYTKKKGRDMLKKC